MSSFKPGDWVHIPILQTEPVQYRLGLCNLGLELWRPKQNEWCWHIKTKQLIQIDLLEMSDYDAIGHAISGSKHDIKYEDCEPFRGQLPSFCRINSQISNQA